MSTDPGNLVPGSLPTTFIPTSSAGNVGYMVMSYPGRPQMVPGIAVPPGMPMPATMAHGMPYMSIGGASPMVSGVPMPMPPYNMGVKMMPSGVPRRQPGPKQKHQTSHPPQNQSSHQQPKEVPVVHNVNVPDGPPVTVFVGNIAEKAPDQMIRYMLSACGSVTSWKRVQGFGFCEFSNPDAGLRAIRLLRDYEIGIKKIVVKVDTKTEAVLEEYKNDKRKKKARGSPLQDEVTEEDDYMDEDMRIADRIALERIDKVLTDFETELKAAISSANEEARIAAEKQRMNEILPPPSIKPVDLADVHIEDDRRDLITREIGKFREIMKKQEEEKEVERKRREEKERERRERSQGSTRSRSVSPASSSPTEHVSSRSSRHRHRSRHHTRSKSRERERERETRDKEKKEERERERERDSKSDKDMLREKEEEEEAKEKKKAERKAREKEAAYQERLRAWESRERHKLKESIKEKDKKKSKEDEREKEAKRLKQFLEDYDDERDDVKYYKGRELARRLEEREKEMEADAKDKQREKEELLELKNKIYSENTDDPGMQFAKAVKEREELYKPKILINVNTEYKSSKSRENRDKHKDYSKEKERQRDSERERDRDRGHERERDDDRRRSSSNSVSQQQHIPLPPQHMSMIPQTLAIPQSQTTHQPKDTITPTTTTPITVQTHNINTNIISIPSPDHEYNDNQDSTNIVSKEVNLLSSPVNNQDKRKKNLDVKEVFNNDEDDDNNVNSKKRKLVPIDYNEDKKKAKEDKKEELAKVQEEKRKRIKSIIDRIPTDKNNLFSQNLDWAAVDSQLMDKRIRPWINKKIVEYIGEPEPTLVDFICSKVLAGSSPQGILDDVQMVLDDEAEVFVVKMWRLLIYEIEAKKLSKV